MGPIAPENHNNTRLRAGGFWIAGAFVFLAIVFVVRVPVALATET